MAGDITHLSIGLKGQRFLHNPAFLGKSDEVHEIHLFEFGRVSHDLGKLPLYHLDSQFIGVLEGLNDCSPELFFEIFIVQSQFRVVEREAFVELGESLLKGREIYGHLGLPWFLRFWNRRIVLTIKIILQSFGMKMRVKMDCGEYEKLLVKFSQPYLTLTACSSLW